MNIGNQNFRLRNFAMQNFNTGIKNREVLKRESSNRLFKVNESSQVKYTVEDLLNEYSGMPMDMDFNFSKKKGIPKGHSRYEYGGATLDIFRHDDVYKSQFVHPSDFSRDDFIKHFPNLKPVTRSSNRTNSNAIETVNGLIDENSIQGATGDCWLISSLYSMASTEKGQEIIKNSITVNDDSSVTVTFGGLGVSYTITNAELSKHDTDNIEYDAYVNGDNDVLAMELAVEKLWKDINSGKVTLNTDNEDLLYAGEGEGIENGGLPSQLVYYLTGIESNDYYNDDLSNLSKDKIYEILKKAYNEENSALSFGVYGYMHTATLINGTEFELDTQGGGHGLAITDVQQDTVTFVNPWDTSVKYTMSWDEFASLGIGYISYSNLDNSTISTEIEDMTDETSVDDSFSYDNIFIPDNDFEPRRITPDNYFEPNDYSNEDNFGFGYDFGISSIISLLERLINILKSLVG